MLVVLEQFWMSFETWPPLEKASASLAASASSVGSARVINVAISSVLGEAFSSFDPHSVVTGTFIGPLGQATVLANALVDNRSGLATLSGSASFQAIPFVDNRASVNAVGSASAAMTSRVRNLADARTDAKATTTALSSLIHRPNKTISASASTSAVSVVNNRSAAVINGKATVTARGATTYVMASSVSASSTAAANPLVFARSQASLSASAEILFAQPHLLGEAAGNISAQASATAVGAVDNAAVATANGQATSAGAARIKRGGVATASAKATITLVARGIRKAQSSIQGKASTVAHGQARVRGTKILTATAAASGTSTNNYAVLRTINGTATALANARVINIAISNNEAVAATAAGETSVKKFSAAVAEGFATATALPILAGIGDGALLATAMASGVSQVTYSVLVSTSAKATGSGDARKLAYAEGMSFAFALLLAEAQNNKLSGASLFSSAFSSADPDMLWAVAVEIVGHAILAAETSNIKYSAGDLTAEAIAIAKTRTFQDLLERSDVLETVYSSTLVSSKNFKNSRGRSKYPSSGGNFNRGE